MSKKIIAITLVIITIFSAMTITVSAASYSTGTYCVSSSSGINVRKGAGTGYSKVGAASKGITFTVSKVNGSWGYTSSIKCTNGTKAGWVSLDYCSKKSTSANNTSSASKYTTGSYTINSNSGVNVRKGAGTGYSKVGAAARGTTFNVSKVSGAWGYSSSIKCTNGTRAGWVSLDYCVKNSSINANTVPKGNTSVSTK
ncbi:MAG: SH3 domain-containing protein, partial [Clostridia bacterium]|nr:SH3 domain-containing protein [Clostridia bacterium]